MKTIAIILAISITVISLIGNSGCANIIPPEGGPRDTIPPILVEARPEDSTVNFRGNRVTLNFDEYIDLQEVQNNLLFTPIFENNPRVEAKLKTITVHFRDTLEPNTTYTLNFGNAIRDINESNVLRDFSYKFSTGPVMDSLELGGKVILAENGGTDSTLIVMLHRNLDDSAVVKEKPRYVSRVDASGNFRFQNLPAGTFAIYALGDAGTIRRYQSSNQLFAFRDQPVTIGSTDTVNLYAYREEPANKTGTNLPQAAQNIPASDRRLRFTTNISSNQIDLLKDLVLSFPTPLKQFDSTRMALYTDSIFNRAVFTSSLDSTRKELKIRTAWKENTAYHLVLDKDFAEDTLGRKLLKSDTLSFNTKKLTEYGQLRLRIRNIDASKNPVLLFVQNDQVVFSVPISSGSYQSNLFLPGDYELRILYDNNKNGKWDPGNFFGKKRQPELVRPITDKISVKPSWENEFERSL
jgi:hypothetical protein